MTSEQFEEEIRDVNGTKVVVTTYKIDAEFYCHVSNFEPGATIARASAIEKEVAVNEAVRKASERIIRYRRTH
jgi:hypothetical protein